MTHLHPLLRLIYFLLRSFAWLSGQVFYRRRIVLGRAHLQHFQGPAIVVSNHPSTLMDPLNVGVPIPKEMFFLANYGLFKNPVSNWILTRLFCIPIKRKEDVAEGDARNNDSAFEQSFQHLEKQGILFIAPEGYSWMNRWVREFKTGTARIAFGAENRNNWQLGLKIYPVGLTYSAPNLFRSQVVIHYGEPLSVATWAASYQQHRAKSVDALTAELQQRVTDLTVHTRDEAGQLLIERLDEMLANAYPLPPAETFYRSQNLAHHYLDREDMRAAVTGYFDTLQTVGLQDLGMQEASPASANRNSLWTSFFLVLTFPFWLLGYAFWWLPCVLPWLLVKRLKLYVGYDSTLKILSGALLFPLWLWAVYRIMRHFSGSGALALAGIAAFILLAFFAERYQDVFRRFRAKQQALSFAKKQPEDWKTLVKKRSDLLATVAEEQKIKAK